MRPAITKEVHFFDLAFDRGERWYRGHFPRSAGADDAGTASRLFTGEATPYYLFHPSVPERAASVVPDTKLIAVLRDPVKRLLSHYYHGVSLGVEHRPLERALAQEPRMLAAEEAEAPVWSADQHRAPALQLLQPRTLRGPTHTLVPVLPPRAVLDPSIRGSVAEHG